VSILWDMHAVSVQYCTGTVQLSDHIRESGVVFAEGGSLRLALRKVSRRAHNSREASLLQSSMLFLCNAPSILQSPFSLVLQSSASVLCLCRPFLCSKRSALQPPVTASDLHWRAEPSLESGEPKGRTITAQGEQASPGYADGFPRGAQGSQHSAIGMLASRPRVLRA